MTAVATQAGAPFSVKIDWPGIDWRKVKRNVRRLQARIVKAIEAGKWGKAKALQHLLTHSFSGKALAVKRVTENRGKRTPGVDGEIWDTPRKKAQGISELRQHGYRAKPLKRKYIPKPNGKQRPLGIPTMKDRAMQALYKLALDPMVETTGDPNSYGFRKGRSPADAIAQCFLCLRQKTSPGYILEGDIRGCFDNFSHTWMLTNIPIEKGILAQWLQAGYIDKGVFRRTEAGSPQGGIISPALANMALDRLEELIESLPHRGTKRQAKVHIIRFADDFIITGSSKELLEEDILPGVVEFMGERGLELSAEKTRITRIEDGFDFLGQTLRKHKGKLIIKPSNKSVKGLLRKVRQTIRENKQVSAGTLITQLNPIIRGWANYHRHVVSKQTFAKVDYLIHQSLWRWVRRRHREKGARWVKKKYFREHKGQKWVFYGQASKTDGTKREVRLVSAAQTPTRWHVKVKAKANPYDPKWERYFERRLQAQMADALKGKQKLLRLWQSQDGKCPVCREKITSKTGWENHHIQWRVHGGPDTMENRVLLHPTCHRQVHSHGITVLKPRPTQGR
jgi:RNA-directed DNA polymerase